MYPYTPIDIFYAFILMFHPQDYSHFNFPYNLFNLQNIH